jgi:hypothetical protein
MRHREHLIDGDPREGSRARGGKRVHRAGQRAAVKRTANKEARRRAKGADHGKK